MSLAASALTAVLLVGCFFENSIGETEMFCRDV